MPVRPPPVEVLVAVAVALASVVVVAVARLVLVRAHATALLIVLPAFAIFAIRSEYPGFLLLDDNLAYPVRCC